MVEDIAGMLEGLAVDTDRCPSYPVSTIRRRGDRRRTAVRVAATGGTVVFVGATAGTGYALAAHTAPGSAGHVGFATQTSSHPGPHHQSAVTHRSGHHARSHDLRPGSATPTPSPTSPWPVGSSLPPVLDSPTPAGSVAVDPTATPSSPAG